MWIIPSLDLVVVWNGAKIKHLTKSPGNPDTRSNKAVRLLVGAVTGH